jgi:putative intracellular protease/amidase
MRILMVLTSHDRLGATGAQTGFWLEELAAPYYVFLDSGASITLASPAGGQPPMDPQSNDPGAQSAATHRFKQDESAQKALANTRKLADVNPAEFDAVFYPGGHGPLWDLAEDAHSIALINATVAANKPVAVLCHAPGVLRHVKGADGRPLVFGKKVTSFSNTEEEAVHLTNVVTFLVEDMLVKSGGHYTKQPNWQPHVVTDGPLVFGQNPASSEPAANAVLELIRARR